MQDSTLKLLSFLLVREINKIIYFPLWWYTNGFIKILKLAWEFIQDFNLTLGFSIWLKNLFVPMFGQTDMPGRIISFFLRFFNIIFRGLALLFFIIIVTFFILVWLVLPVFILYQIYNNLF